MLVANIHDEDVHVVEKDERGLDVLDGEGLRQVVERENLLFVRQLDAQRLAVARLCQKKREGGDHWINITIKQVQTIRLTWSYQ